MNKKELIEAMRDCADKRSGESKGLNWSIQLSGEEAQALLDIIDGPKTESVAIGPDSRVVSSEPIWSRLGLRDPIEFEKERLLYAINVYRPQVGAEQFRRGAIWRCTGRTTRMKLKMLEMASQGHTVVLNRSKTNVQHSDAIFRELREWCVQLDIPTHLVLDHRSDTHGMGVTIFTDDNS